MSAAKIAPYQVAVMGKPGRHSKVGSDGRPLQTWPRQQQEAVEARFDGRTRPEDYDFWAEFGECEANKFDCFLPLNIWLPLWDDYSEESFP